MCICILDDLHPYLLQSGLHSYLFGRDPQTSLCFPAAGEVGEKGERAEVEFGDNCNGRERFMSCFTVTVSCLRPSDVTAVINPETLWELEFFFFLLMKTRVLGSGKVEVSCLM